MLTRSDTQFGRELSIRISQEIQKQTDNITGSYLDQTQYTKAVAKVLALREVLKMVDEVEKHLRADK